MVEFAIILPFLALLLVMTIDFGRVFFGWVALQNASRIAADFAARTADAWPAPSGGAIGALARDRYYELVIADLTAINCSPDSGVNRDWAEADVSSPSFRNPDGTTSGDVKEPGDHAVTRLECFLPLITPLAQSIIGGPVELGSEAYFAINGSVATAFPTSVPFPTPTPAPTPTPGPTDCDVVNYVGLRANAAENLWDAAGFTGAFTRTSSGNFTVGSQTLSPGTYPCSSSITIGADPGLTPAPTPSPGSPTPVPTPSPVPTPTPLPTPACQPPVASFTAVPTTGVRPLTVQFTDTSTSQNCAITAWSWNFGDGSPTVTTQNASHVFTYNGNAASNSFTVTLIVTNANGARQATTNIVVTR